MTHIALIVPNFVFREEFGRAFDPPIGTASIAAVLEEAGHEVSIIDAMVENLSRNEIITRIQNIGVHYVGISCNYCTLHNPTLLLAQAIKQAMGNTYVFVGGNHATSLAQVLLKQAAGYIDCIVLGEGEAIVPQLIESLERTGQLNKVSGICFVQEGHISHNTDTPGLVDVDALPMPAYHLLPMKLYQRYNLVSMRGCPFGCSFCASTAIFGRKIRYKSTEKTVSEILFLLQNYGDRHFWFSDDTFTVNHIHTKDLLNKILKNRIRIDWSCLTTVNTVQPDLLELMKKSGCKYISYGIETGHAGFSSYLGKKISPKGILETSTLTWNMGIPHYGFFIIGFPGESHQSVRDTYEMISNLKISGGSMNLLIPLPGTKLWESLFRDRKLFTVEELRWDEMFASLKNESGLPYSAQLAARWSNLSAEELNSARLAGQLMLDSKGMSE